VLVDLPPIVIPDPLNRAIYGDDIGPRRVAQGVYLTHLNFGYDLKRENLLLNDYPFDFGHLYSHEEREEMGEDAYMAKLREFYRRDHPADYGVCDNWEQIPARWPEIVTSPRHFVISVTEMRRKDQEPAGGWRWHKWGEYIGDHEIKHEYLYDENHIESVFTFHIMEVR
jgi:hypothetical protein